jgi:hypothetical protein
LRPDDVGKVFWANPWLTMLDFVNAACSATLPQRVALYHRFREGSTNAATFDGHRHRERQPGSEMTEEFAAVVLDTLREMQATSDRIEALLDDFLRRPPAYAEPALRSDPAL